MSKLVNAFGEGFIQKINQERPVRLFHLVFNKFTKLKDYTSVANVSER